MKKSLVHDPSPNFEELIKQGIVCLDSRTPKDFENGFIPGTLSLPLSMNFAIWAGTLFLPDTKFFIIAEPGKEKETIIRLARIGYDQIVGVLDGGFESYRASGKKIEKLNKISAASLTHDHPIIDVRNPGEH